MEPDRIKDLFKRLYQNLVPKSVRHDLGEYYTPDWLAELVLDEVSYTERKFASLREGGGEPLAPLDLRVLDPACGSGTFLILAVKRLREYIDEHWIDRGSALRRITKNIVGFDLNPLAVMASRANYLISIGDLLREKGAEQIEIPIYLADSILVDRRTTVFGTSVYILRTVAGEFRVPIGIVERGDLGAALTVMDECVRTGRYSPDEFMNLLGRKISLPEDETPILKELFTTVSKLEKERKDGIWLRILRNSFAPLLSGKFDFVIGNPPWIGWSSLPEAYRKATSGLWAKFGLISESDAIRAEVKKDVAMLFVTTSNSRYLNESGRLAFLLPFTLFKSQAAAGFRNYLATRAAVTSVHDLVELSPFEGAINRTALLVFKKGRTKFPIYCLSWKKRKSGKISFESTLQGVRDSSSSEELVLVPLGGARKPETPWVMAREAAVYAIEKLIGQSTYEAHSGVDTGLNSVYWVQIRGNRQGSFLIRNLSNVGKKKVTEISTDVESELVYPLMRGRDVSRWSAEPSVHILLPHKKDGTPLAEREAKVEFPNCYKYFLTFKKDLMLRSTHRLMGKGNPFFAVHKIGNYTFAPYKVVWKEVAGKISGKGDFICAVIGPRHEENLGNRVVICDHKLMLVSFSNEDEAHYVCAVVNSSFARLIVASYTIETSISTHILKHIMIHGFDPRNPLHIQLSNLSKNAHKLQSMQNAIELKEIEQRIDGVVATMYGISDQEANEVRKSLAALLGSEFEIEEPEDSE